MTTATLLDSLVGNDGENFSASQKSSAITTAQTYLGTSDGDSDPKDMATALLAQLILINLRKSGDSQQPLSELITDEIRALVNDPNDFQSNENIFDYDTSGPNSSETWY